MPDRTSALDGLVFVGDRCRDHSPSSGYDQVCAIFPDAGWLSGRTLAAGELLWHRTSETNLGSESVLFHVLYGDCSGRSAPRALRTRYPKATIVASVHQPVARMLADSTAWDALAHVDAVITVSKDQADDLSRERLTPSVHAIPHGVWMRSFRRPSAHTTERDGVLLVGNYLRDWALAKRAVETLAAQGVRSIILGSAVPPDLFISSDLIQRTPRVTEPELAALYESSAAMLLPVLDATASNALLEAMAAGCPVICPALPSLVDEYLGDGSDSFEPGRPDQAVTKLLSYVRDPSRRERRSQKLMQRVERFDWSSLRDRFAATYAEVLARRPVRS